MVSLGPPTMHHLLLRIWRKGSRRIQTRGLRSLTTLKGSRILKEEGCRSPVRREVLEVTIGKNSRERYVEYVEVCCPPADELPIVSTSSQGTVFYMARAVLLNLPSFRHRPAHDLESLLILLVEGLVALSPDLKAKVFPLPSLFEDWREPRAFPGGF